MDSYIILLANFSITVGYLLIKIGSALVRLGKDLRNPHKKEIKKINKVKKLEDKLKDIKGNENNG